MAIPAPEGALATNLPDPRRERARKVVAFWLAGLWISKPEWVNRMPDYRDMDELTDLIAAELKE